MVRIVGLIMIAFGALWIAQGTGVFPVGPMANQMMWTWIGAALAIAGLVVTLRGGRRA